MKKTVEELVAEAAARELQIRYCRGVDRMDFDLLRSCFHADATADYGFFKGSIDDFVAMAKDSLKIYTHTTHFTGNQLVEVKGDSAWAEHYTVATHRCPADEQGPVRDFVTIVRYIDCVERRDDDWRIARRVLVLDSWRTDPVLDTGPGPQVQPGQRDVSDPSYSLR